MSAPRDWSELNLVGGTTFSMKLSPTICVLSSQLSVDTQQIVGTLRVTLVFSVCDDVSATVIHGAYICCFVFQTGTDTPLKIIVHVGM